MKGYNKLRKKAFWILNSKLSDKLYYHGIHHTINALHACEPYLKSAKIKGSDGKLLRIGILLHDIGFTVSHVDHERESVKIAIQLMTKFGFSKRDIDIVKGLILATRVPQTPKTSLERIICDVDLDYLGGSDFYPISNQLYKELKIFSNIGTLEDWEKRQIIFLKAHKYHTDFARKNRQPQKEQRIEELNLKMLKALAGQK